MNHPFKPYNDNTAGAPHIQILKYIAASDITFLDGPIAQRANSRNGFCIIISANPIETAITIERTRSCLKVLLS
ncbi:hypothetical protein prwr041_24570 [Prevotella herbatica]|uniref:Uncharacterized protein n=1 Tax=Prevotella herbatica TaxID=2801997 RepID=A0ABM7P1B1_9BACT|nr:hypothetical protein prwr041_24570 [Prevotella herbatica]